MRRDGDRESRESRRTSASVMIPRLMLIGCVVVLLALGLVMVYSASSVEAYSEFGDAGYFLKRQAGMMVGAIVICIIVALIPFRIWRSNLLWGIWLISVLLLFATVIFGSVGLGAQRWIYIGSFGFQPSEFSKIAVLLLCAHLIVQYREGDGGSFRRFLVNMLVAVMCPAILIIVQPDLGTTLILMVGVIVVLWFGEISRKLIIGVIIAVAVLAVLAVVFVGFRSSRLVAWLNPWADPLDSGYQIINSFYAFAEGGVFGVGLGNSTQKYLYLTYAYNDFIFAIIGEELGLVGAVAVIGLFLAFIFSAFRIGRTSSDMFGMIIANSMSATIVFQAFLNIACVTGVLPVTGKPLPFISYGGTSLIATMIMVGFVLAVSFQNAADEHERRRGQIRSFSGGASSSRTRAVEGPRSRLR